MCFCLVHATQLLPGMSVAVWCCLYTSSGKRDTPAAGVGVLRCRLGGGGFPLMAQTSGSALIWSRYCCSTAMLHGRVEVKGCHGCRPAQVAGCPSYNPQPGRHIAVGPTVTNKQQLTLKKHTVMCVFLKGCCSTPNTTAAALRL